MTFQPMRGSWLSPGFDNILADEPDLLLAYELPDYPREMSGEGDWVDLYLDADGKFPVGRLWMSPDNNSMGCEILADGGNMDHLTRVALQLRQFNEVDAHPISAFEFVKDQYQCGPINTGDLVKAKDGIIA